MQLDYCVFECCGSFYRFVNWRYWALIFWLTFLGIGTFIRGILILVAIENNIVEFNFMFCSTSISIIFAVCYRLESFIALMIAIDRLTAIWKPIWYNNNQNYVNFLTVFVISLQYFRKCVQFL